MNKRPVLKIKLVFLDYLLEICSLVVLISTLFFIIINLNSLSNSVPTHFDFYGAADSYGNKFTVFIPFITSIVFYIGLSILAKYPHIYNYPVKITEQNAKQVYRIGIRIIRAIKLLFLSLLLYISIKIIYGI